MPTIYFTDELIDATAAMLALPDDEERNPEHAYFVATDTLPRMTVTGKPCISGVETPDGTSDAGDNVPSPLSLIWNVQAALKHGERLQSNAVIAARERQAAARAKVKRTEWVEEFI